MYDDHYGLRGRPFQLTPDPRFWFESATHKKAMAYLGYGLSQGEGFIVVTGDIGAGKTTLVGHLMASIDREQLHVIKLVSTQIEADDLLRLVAQGLDIDCAGLVKAQLLDRIERQLHAVARSGRRTLLIVDEAQALAISALEELRMLSNFQAGGHALLQIFLLGQPEFRARLNGSARLEQLRQRIIALHHLEPMARTEIEPYVLHRLRVVGWTGNPHFSPDAFDALYDGSGGVPRRLNHLAGRVMLFGAVEQCAVIDAAIVHAVLADSAGDHALAGRDDVAGDAQDATPVLAAAAGFDDAAAGPVWPTPDTLTAGSRAAPSPAGPACDDVAGWPLVLDGAPVEDSVSATLGAPLSFAAGAPEHPPATIAATTALDTRPAAVSRNEDAERISAPPLPGVAQDVDAPVPALPPSPAAAEALAPPADHALHARLAALEARVEEQETALRRVLTLLVDWVESDSQRPDLSAFTGSAA